MSKTQQKLHVEIISPAGVIFDGHCKMASIPGTNGDLGIMFNHEPVLTRLNEGKVTIFNEGNKVAKSIEITGGFAHNVEEKLLILANN